MEAMTFDGPAAKPIPGDQPMSDPGEREGEDEFRGLPDDEVVGIVVAAEKQAEELDATHASQPKWHAADG